jgi:hypothetical protein
VLHNHLEVMVFLSKFIPLRNVQGASSAQTLLLQFSRYPCGEASLPSIDCKRKEIIESLREVTEYDDMVICQRLS